MRSAASSPRSDRPAAPDDRLRAGSPSGDPARQAAIDELNLAMLFIDSGTVEVTPTTGPDLEMRLTPDPPLRAVALAALLCRVLHDPRIRSLTLERIRGGLRLVSTFRLPSGDWTVILLAAP